MRLQNRLSLTSIAALQSTTRGRVLLGIAANIFGKFGVFLAQIIAVPALTHAWGGSKFGLWLMLSTVPTYISLSTFGFGEAAAADMTKKAALGDRDGALCAFQSVWLLLSAILLVIALVCGALLFLPYADLIAATLLHTELYVLKVSALFGLFSIVAIQMSVISVGYRSTGRYALGTFFMELLYPIEVISICISALMGGGFITAAVTILFIRFTATLAYYLLLRSKEPWIALGWRYASLSEVRRLARPAIGAVSLTAAAAINIQLLVVTLGLFVSPAATAAFSTSRTLSRAPLQFANLAGRATLPEMTAAYTKNDHVLSAKLALVNIGCALAISLPATLVLVVFGSRILHLLSHGTLSISPLTITLLALTAFFQASWTAIAQFLVAINKQYKFSLRYVLLSLLVAFSPVVLRGRGVTEMVAGTWCAAEAIILVNVFWLWWREGQIAISDIRRALTSLVRGGPSVASLARLLLRRP